MLYAGFRTPHPAFRTLLDLPPLAAPSDKAENDARVGCKLPGRREHCVERMARAVVARIHHHEFPVQAMRLAESLPPFGVKPNLRVVRPGRNDDHLGRSEERRGGKECRSRW